MSRLLDDDEQPEQRDRELTLSTGAILGIFLGLVLLCAVFFGFGYNLGRKSTVIANANVPASTDDNSPSTDTSFDKFKPAAASDDEAKPTPASADTQPAAPQPIKTKVAAEESPAPTKPAPATARTQPVTTAPAHTTPGAPPSPALRTPDHQPSAPAPTATPGGAFIVQVAAISHKEDADLLVTALRGKGYAVAARPSDQDKLLHIQVGPFATRKDAEAMRERLIVDGYNAIVK